MSSASSSWSGFLAASLHLSSLEGGLQCAVTSNVDSWELEYQFPAELFLA